MGRLEEDGWASEGLDDGALRIHLNSGFSILDALLLAGSRRILFEETRTYQCMSYRRLYAKGRVLGHKRSKRNSRPNTSLLQIEGVANKEDTQFYLGKVCYCVLVHEQE